MLFRLKSKKFDLLALFDLMAEGVIYIFFKSNKFLVGWLMLIIRMPGSTHFAGAL